MFATRASGDKDARRRIDGREEREESVEDRVIVLDKPWSEVHVNRTTRGCRRGWHKLEQHRDAVDDHLLCLPLCLFVQPCSFVYLLLHVYMYTHTYVRGYLNQVHTHNTHTHSNICLYQKT